MEKKISRPPKFKIGGGVSANGTVIFEAKIKKNSEAFGRLVIRDGGIHWFSKHSRKAERIGWDQFNTLIS